MDSTATGRPRVCILWRGGVSCPVSAAWHFCVAAHWSKYHCYKQAPSWYDLRCFKAMLNPNKQTNKQNRWGHASQLRCKSSQRLCAPVSDTWDWTCDGALQSVATCMPGLYKLKMMFAKILLTGKVLLLTENWNSLPWKLVVCDLMKTYQSRGSNSHFVWDIFFWTCSILTTTKSSK